jgi:hypothetical protein
MMSSVQAPSRESGGSHGFSTLPFPRRRPGKAGIKPSVTEGAKAFLASSQRRPGFKGRNTQVRDSTGIPGTKPPSRAVAAARIAVRSGRAERKARGAIKGRGMRSEAKRLRASRGALIESRGTRAARRTRALDVLSNDKSTFP